MMIHKNTPSVDYNFCGKVGILKLLKQPNNIQLKSPKKQTKNKNLRTSKCNGMLSGLSSRGISRTAAADKYLACFNIRHIFGMYYQ